MWVLYSLLQSNWSHGTSKTFWCLVRTLQARQWVPDLFHTTGRVQRFFLSMASRTESWPGVETEPVETCCDPVAQRDWN